MLQPAAGAPGPSARGAGLAEPGPASLCTSWLSWLRPRSGVQAHGQRARRAALPLTSRNCPQKARERQVCFFSKVYSLIVL